MATALFRNTFSGLITKGLGGPASRGLITMSFGLSISPVTATIVIPVIPVVPVSPNFGGGGGGYTGNGSIATHPNIYTPYTGNARKERRHVTFAIKFNEINVWRTQYNLSLQKLSLVVRAINLTNVTTHWIAVSVSHIKRAVRNVTTKFK